MALLIVPLLPASTAADAAARLDNTALVEAAALPPAGEAALAPAEDGGLVQDAPPAVADGIVYFTSGSAQLPPEAGERLQHAIDALKANPGTTAAISGYHDASGDAAVNAELARQRAQNVANALAVAGIDAARLDLRKPVVADGGDEAAARRVEVVVE